MSDSVCFQTFFADDSALAGMARLERADAGVKVLCLNRLGYIPMYCLLYHKSDRVSIRLKKIRFFFYLKKCLQSGKNVI